MRKIQMVDLHSQYSKIKVEIDNAIHEVVESTAFIKGPQVISFEKELAEALKVKHVIACANGTDALQIALMALNLKPGDEVITTSFTFIATVEVIALLGLKPVFVDVDYNTFNIIPEQIEKAITSRTKAIMPVHLFGQSVNMDAVMEIARKHNLYVVEDACQATGADFISGDGKTYKAGSIGDIGCTSFFPSKNLGCFGDGGALFTNNDKLAEQIKIIANHGMKVRYFHDCIGVNSRLDSIQAAILRVKLPYLENYNDARRKAAHYYNRELASIPGIITPSEAANARHIFHQYTLKITGYNRDGLRDYLEKNNIPAMIYYPVPIHKQKAFDGLSVVSGDLPISEKLSTEVLSLPMHTELDEEQLQYICNHIKKYCQL